MNGCLSVRQLGYCYVYVLYIRITLCIMHVVSIYELVSLSCFHISSFSLSSTFNMVSESKKISPPSWPRVPPLLLHPHPLPLSRHCTTKQSHHGPETLKLGNNQGMKIMHTGSAHYIVPHTNTMFVLRNLLHVPHITKNLISVAQFTKDNNVYFQFSANACYVKH